MAATNSHDSHQFISASEQEKWRTYLYQSYQHDAEQAISHYLDPDIEDHEIDQHFIEHVIELLRTYVDLPEVGYRPSAVDESIINLAYLIAGAIFHLGYWRQINYLWPKLGSLAEALHDPERYFNFMKLLAIVKGRQHDGQDGVALYRTLLRDPRFPQVSAHLRADILNHVGTALLWGGHPREAESLLQQALALTTDYMLEQNIRGPRSATRQYNIHAAPLWETRSYALNQLGVLYMFRGDFWQARIIFDQMFAIYVAYGEVDKLASVAYQAIGRLSLYTRVYEHALPIIEKGLVIRQRYQDWENIAANMIYLAAIQIHRGHLTQAELLLQEALQSCQHIDQYHDIALCHLYLGELAYYRKQWPALRLHWHSVCVSAKKIVLHYVELHLWLRYLLPLLLHGEIVLCREIVRTLWRSSRHDQLSLHELWRFLWR